MADINAIAEQIQGLTLLEASQLVKLLEEKLGVSAAAAAPVMVALLRPHNYIVHLTLLWMFWEIFLLLIIAVAVSVK